MSQESEVVQIEIGFETPEFHGQYSELSLVRVEANEVYIQFYQLSPMPKDPPAGFVLQAKCIHRIIVAPEHARNLIEQLTYKLAEREELLRARREGTVQ